MYNAARSVQNDRRISRFVEAGCVSAAILAGSGKIYTGASGSARNAMPFSI